MGRSLNAPLSLHEEVALRRVALGVGPRDILSARAIARLKSLELIEVSESGVRLTPIGEQRYSALPGVSPVANSSVAKKALQALVASGADEAKH